MLAGRRGWCVQGIKRPHCVQVKAIALARLTRPLHLFFCLLSSHLTLVLLVP